MATKNSIRKRCMKLADMIESEREVLADILLKYESYETVCDEVFRSIDCLRNIDIEIGNLTEKQLNSICAFFPLNLPLYSLILFAIIPSFIANKVFVRQPERMGNILQDIYRALNLKEIVPNVAIVDISRGNFIVGYASVSNAIIFTGTYENAKFIQRNCPNSFFIYNGAGINPIVISESADLEIAAQKVTEMRVFNSGQDCAGPDAILVNGHIYQDFLDKLIGCVTTIKIGDYYDRDVRVGKLGDYKQMPIISAFFDRYHNQIVMGGKIDFKNYTVYPTIISTSLQQEAGFQEFFAPVFNLIKYDSDSDLKQYFDNERYQDHAMYISLFGSSSYVEGIKHSQILNNKIVNDVERGNYPYGGHGRKASFVIYGDKCFPRPILISQEITKYLKNKK